MGVAVTDDATKSLYAAYSRRMRDEIGVKFQLVLYDYAKADYMGVISVNNRVLDEGWSEAGLVYWVIWEWCPMMRRAGSPSGRIS